MRLAGQIMACLLCQPVTTYWQGKRVLLTGASSGLGESLARELSARGATLAISARRADRLADVASSCAAPARVHVLPMDLVSDSPDELGAKVVYPSTL